MPVVEPLEENEIEPELREYVQFFKGPLGVVPNSVRTMAYQPRIARAFTDLNIAVMQCEGDVTPEFKRLIGYVTSMVSGCRYCQAHTILGSERFGSSEERLNNVFNYAASEHFSDAEKAALDFAFAAAEVPQRRDRRTRREPADALVRRGHRRDHGRDCIIWLPESLERLDGFRARGFANRSWRQVLEERRLGGRQAHLRLP